MAELIGYLRDVNAGSMKTHQAQLHFIPSSVALSTASTSAVHTVFPTRTIVVELEPDGYFHTDLVATDSVLPGTFCYRIVIIWLNGDNVPIGRDDVPWPLFISEPGGRLSELLATPWNPSLAWVGDEPPLGAAVEKALWLDTDSPLLTLSIWRN